MNEKPLCCILCSMGAIVLMQYPVFKGDRSVGEVTLKKEGLFCRLHCFCTVKKPERLQLICYGEKESLDLGGGIPKDNRWELRRFFSQRNLPEGDLKFMLRDGEKRLCQKLLPGEPVEQISTLANGRLVCCEDGYWIQATKDT